ncbi:MAG: hypothetical protein IMZ55_14700, partial [Acidobacteria bacterium]|nr:hypothetical protein [Acidobacteriota bacterium]
LENGDPSLLAESIGKLFREMIGQQAGRGRSAVTVPFSIAADDRTRSLVVSTTAAHFTLVEQILKSLDQTPASPESDVQYVYLENADATEVASQLNDMYKARKGVDKPVITADTFSNAVTIIAKDAELKLMEPIIAKLDDAAKDNNFRVRVIPLTAVKAERIAEVLRTVYKQMSGNDVTISQKAPDAPQGAPGEAGPTGPAAPAPAPAAPATPAPDQKPPAPAAPAPEPKPAEPAPATPALAAPPAPAPAAPAAPAEPAAKTPATPEQPRGVNIVVDKSSNSLILTGKRQELDYLQDLLDQLLLSTSSDEAEFRTYKLEKADPVSVADTLDDLFNPKPRQQARPQQGQPPPPPAPEPPPVISVVPDARTRSIIVRAKALDFEDVEKLIKQLDQVPTVISEVRIFNLKNTEAVEVAKNLQDLFQRAQQAPQPPQPPQPQPPQQPGGRGRRGGGNAQQQRADMIREIIELRTKDGVTQVDIASMVAVTANRQTNSVIVTAPVDAMEIVAGIIEELDQSGVAAAPAVRMYPVKSEDVTAMVTALREVFVPKGRGARGSATTVIEKEVVITGDQAGGLVIVSASADQQELIATVIEEMDQAQAGGEVAVKVYRLESADATSVATALSATVERSGAGGGRRGQTAAGQIRISADRSSNAVVVRAPAEDHLRIAQLISEMDKGPEAIVKTYPVKNADVQTVVTALKEIVAASGPAGGRGGRGGAAGDTSITGDEAGRLIVVSASKEKHELIAKIIDEIDQAQNQDQVTVKVYRLENADASDVSSALQA